MVEAAERDGLLKPGSILVESSSGNLGVALSMIAASKGYRFLCVTDSRCNLSTRLLMEALGSQVHVVTEPRRARRAARRPARPTSAHCAPPTTGTCGSNQYTNPSQLAGALPHDRAGDRPPVPASSTCCSSGRAPPER